MTIDLHLELQFGLAEGQQEALAVVGAQAVNTAGVDGETEIVIDRFLWGLVAHTVSEAQPAMVR